MLLQLRKVSELDRPSARLKADEGDSLLEQIKNKVIFMRENCISLVIVGENGLLAHIWFFFSFPVLQPEAGKCKEAEH